MLAHYVQLVFNRKPPLHHGRQWLWVHTEAVWIPGSAGGVFAGRRWATPAAARLRFRKNRVHPFTRCVIIMADKGVDLNQVNM